jgi:SAM-dependent methyltransferase
MRIKKTFSPTIARHTRAGAYLGIGTTCLELPQESPRPILSRSRMESNAWLRRNAATMVGDVLSLGSRDDADGEGGFYRRYFSRAGSYTTSDLLGEADLVLDIRDMSTVPDNRYNGIFCSGVLEHVDDFHRALSEITRILAPAGTLLLGLPMRQAIHDAPGDFWRFTRFAVEYLLRDRYTVGEIAEIDKDPVTDFPAAYWVKAMKKVVQGSWFDKLTTNGPSSGFE